MGGKPRAKPEPFRGGVVTLAPALCSHTLFEIASMARVAADTADDAGYRAADALQGAAQEFLECAALIAEEGDILVEARRGPPEGEA